MNSRSLEWRECLSNVVACILRVFVFWISNRFLVDFRFNHLIRSRGWVWLTTYWRRHHGSVEILWWDDTFGVCVRWKILLGILGSTQFLSWSHSLFFAVLNFLMDFRNLVAVFHHFFSSILVFYTLVERRRYKLAIFTNLVQIALLIRRNHLLPIL